MPLHLEAIDGPAKGRKLEVPIGRAITVGRTDRAMVKVAEDECMSGLHFALSSKNGSLYLSNLSKSNGTTVNDQSVESGVLQPGDKVKAGQTLFAVVGPSESPYPAKIRIGGWGFAQLPENWRAAEGIGFLHSDEQPFRANMLAVEELLPKDYTLAAYVDLQIQLGQDKIAGAEFKGPIEAKITGASEAFALSMTALVPEKGQAIQQQIYALHRGVVGVFTATALDTQTSMLRRAMKTILGGLSFHQT
jgi:pSer/pThr/pTyr-binding forkhead associated (FHA) protein